ncbi:hypothetical protein LUZ60_000677 [Juncus effusus]|nr:hypothetical protein LUZ60_000677 [Juncus effusus]
MERSNSDRMMTRYRFPISDPDHSGYLECSTQSCRTCSAFAVADCIALCCCPCSVINMLTFSFVKAPYLISRRMLKTIKKKKGLLHRRSNSDIEESDGEIVVDYNVKGFERKSKDWNGELDKGIWGISLGEYKNINSSGRLSTKIDPDKIWMDMYQVGQWGFGRVSFSTNPVGRNSFGKDMVVYQNLKEVKDNDE